MPEVKPLDGVKAEVARLSAIAIQHMKMCDEAILKARALFDEAHGGTPDVDWLIDFSEWHFNEAVRLFAISETLHKEGGW